MALRNTSGKIKMLRVNEIGDRFGPAADFIQAEVIVQLDHQTGDAASGFKLRADANQPVRQGMLDLLRDAFNNGWRVHFDHEVPAGKAKGTIVRVWVTKDTVVSAAIQGALDSGMVFGTVSATPAVVPSTGALGSTAAVGGSIVRRSRKK
jgi:hypothetical protein